MLRNNSRSRKPRVECWNCGKKGHLKKNCRALKKNKHGTNNKDNETSTNIVEEVVEDALVLALDNKSESWVIDSGVSFYATSNKELLKNYM